VLYSSREFDLEVNTDKSVYVVTFGHQSAGQIHSLLIGNKSFEKVVNIQVMLATILFRILCLPASCL